MPRHRDPDAGLGGWPASGGFSLIELMVVITILGIVFAAAVPNFARFVARDRVDAAAQEVQSALALARQKALARRTLYRVSLSGAPVVVLVERQDSTAWVPDPAHPLTLNANVQADALFGGDASNDEALIDAQGMLLSEDAPAEIILFNDRADSMTVRMVRTGRIRTHGE
jgi:type II secretion system protein H